MDILRLQEHFARAVHIATHFEATSQNVLILSGAQELKRLEWIEDLLSHEDWFERLPSAARQYWVTNIEPLTKSLGMSSAAAHGSLRAMARGRREHIEGNLNNPIAETPEVNRIVVASDVHLGTNASRRQAFFEWLHQRRSGEDVVLLGDILDFWIYGKHDDDRALLNRIRVEWISLWNALKRHQNAGVRFHYVPGNHDAFVWFIEAAVHFKWGHALMERTPLLRRLRELTKDHRLSEVVSIHYPYLQLDTKGRTILFTHGHFDSWWDWISHISESESRVRVALSTISVSLAHKHARKLRRAFNEIDFERRTQRIEDVSIAITNSILSAYKGIAEEFDVEPGKLIDKIDQAMAMYFGNASPRSEEDDQRIRDALLYLDVNHASRNAAKLGNAYEREIGRLANSRELNFTIEQNASGSSTPPAAIELRTFRFPGALVVGHHHDPRDEDPFFDTGGFVGNIETWLAIAPDGTFSRPAGS